MVIVSPTRVARVALVTSSLRMNTVEMYLWLLWEWHLVECNIHAWEGTSHGKKWLAMEEHTPFWRAHYRYRDNHGISGAGDA